MKSLLFYCLAFLAVATSTPLNNRYLPPQQTVAASNSLSAYASSPSIGNTFNSYAPPASGSFSPSHGSVHHSNHQQHSAPSAAATTADFAYKTPEPFVNTASNGNLVPATHSTISYSAPSVAALHTLGGSGTAYNTAAASAPSKNYIPPATHSNRGRHCQAAASTSQASFKAPSSAPAATTRHTATQPVQHAVHQQTAAAALTGNSHVHSQPSHSGSAVAHGHSNTYNSHHAQSTAPVAAISSPSAQFSGYPAGRHSAAASTNFDSFAPAATHAAPATAVGHQTPHSSNSRHQSAQFNGYPAARHSQSGAASNNFESFAPVAAAATRTAPAFAHQTQAHRSSGHSAEIGTQYAANGGYVYRRRR